MSPGVPTRAEAMEHARMLLLPLGDRWAHTQGVARRAEELVDAVPLDERELLVVAGWWHDVGYSPELVTSGMHQLDGARYLADEGYADRLCALVAYHSAGTFEAEERGLTGELARWQREEGPVADALWMADMTTGPRGERVEYPDRLVEILHRHEADSVVAQAMRRAQPIIETAIGRVRDRLG